MTQADSCGYLSARLLIDQVGGCVEMRALGLS